MDTELKFLLRISRSLPRVRGAGRVGVAVQRFYQRKPRRSLIAPVFDFQMRLNPNELVDSGLLFYPQLYDRREISILKHTLKPGDVFLDVGANIGFYSLIASFAVGPAGRVIAIEADPEMCGALEENVALNGCENVEALALGVSDCCQTLRLGINVNGNRGSSSFLAIDQPVGINVKCVPLSQIVLERGLRRIAAAKIDIEGFGMKVLQKFFADVSKALFPPLMIVEDESGISALLSEMGYEQLGYWGFNRVFRRALSERIGL